MNRERFSLGEWLVEPELNQLRSAARVRRLEPKAMDVLCYLAAHPDRVVSNDELLENVWPGRVVEASTVHRRINQIRRELGDAPKAPRYIQTIVRRGYRLVAPVGAPESTGAPEPAEVRGTRSRARWVAIVAGVLAVCGLLALVAPFSQPGQTTARTAGDPTVIAVLPFRASPGSDNAILADGITDEVELLIGQMDGLAVISRFSAVRFAQSAGDVRDARRLLDADYVVEGTANREGDDTRFTAALTDTATGTRIWSDEFHAQQPHMTELFATYAEISRRIGLALRVTLDNIESDLGLDAPPTGNLDAYEAYRAAVSNLRRGRWSGGLAAVDQALALDPQFARAHGLRGALVSLQAEVGAIPGKAGYEQAMASVDQALRYDAGLGIAWFWKAYLTARLDLDFPNTLRLLEHAEELGAPKRLTYLIKSELFLNTGRYDEALALTRFGERFDPLNPANKFQTARVLERMGHIAAARRKFDEIIAAGLRGDLPTHYALLHLLRHDREHARRLIEATDPGAIPAWARPRLAYELGDPEPLKTLVRHWIEHRDEQFVTATAISAALLRTGAYEEHFSWVAQQEREHSSLHFMYDNMHHVWGTDGDYWPTLAAWAKGSTERQARLQAHRERIDRIMAKMHLP